MISVCQGWGREINVNLKLEMVGVWRGNQRREVQRRAKREQAVARDALILRPHTCVSPALAYGTAWNMRPQVCTTEADRELAYS